MGRDGGGQNEVGRDGVGRNGVERYGMNARSKSKQMQI